MDHHQHYLPNPSTRRPAASPSVNHFPSDDSSAVYSPLVYVDNSFLSATAYAYAYEYDPLNQGAPPLPDPYHYPYLRQEYDDDGIMIIDEVGLLQDVDNQGGFEAEILNHPLRPILYQYQHHLSHHSSLRQQYDDGIRPHGIPAILIIHPQESVDGIMIIDVFGLQHVDNPSNAAQTQRHAGLEAEILISNYPRPPILHQYGLPFHHPNLRQQYYDDIRQHGTPVYLNNLTQSDDDGEFDLPRGVYNPTNDTPQPQPQTQTDRQRHGGWRTAIRPLGMPVNVNNLQDSDDNIMMTDEIDLRYRYVDNQSSNAAPQAHTHTHTWRHGGLEAEISNYIKVRNSSGVGDEECSDDICVVCQDALSQDNLKIGKLHCGHEYHLHCIMHWLHCKNTCPLCQSVALPMDAI